MLKFLLIFLNLLFLSATLLTGQTKENRRAGSAFNLSGRIYTLSCFVSDNAESWTKKEKLEHLNLLKEGQNWIEKQAGLYGVDVEFVRGGNFGLEEDIKFEKVARGTASGNEPVDWASKVLYKIGYKSTLDLYEWTITNNICDNIHLVVFVKGKGNSYAMAYKENANKEMYFIESCVIYEKYNSARPLAVASIAHEILHLYGAMDLYKTFKQTKENEIEAKKLFPNSIMLRTTYDINELSVDKFNAWLIGWNNKYEKWFDRFMY
jgi:hypothetical protein